MITRALRRIARALALTSLAALPLAAQRTVKPVIHGRHWVAVTGKPLGATAGAMMFAKGGNAIDAACAMLGAVTTMWDVLSWGGETQALIYNPKTGKVIGINALGVAPTGATPDFFRSRGMNNPPEFGPLAAVTPGTPGGLMTMLAEYGTLSLKDVLAPAIQMADGYAIEAQTANSIESNKARIKQWKYSRAVFLPHAGEPREAPAAGEIFVQADLAATLRKLVDAEQAALKKGKTRKEAIYAAYDRFYKGDIAEELVRGVREEGGLFTREDLANWKVKIEEPLTTTYKGYTVAKLPQWQQGAALLQALNLLENADLRAMGYNSARYMHAVYQAMSLAFADRDFYYGDPAFATVQQPMKGLLSKDYAKARWATVNWERNDPAIRPGDPYPFEGATNPMQRYLAQWSVTGAKADLPKSGQHDVQPQSDFALAGPTRAREAALLAGAEAARRFAITRDSLPHMTSDEAFYAGTTSIQAADEEGWVISVTPSGGWVPAVIAGRTGVGLSQRMQSFVTDSADGPWNVVAPGKRPRVTLTPTLALKDGVPAYAFSVQGGDSQDQNLLQFFLNVVEFGMNPQEAVEAPNINSYQMRSSFGAHEVRPGRIMIAEQTPPYVREELKRMGYTLEVERLTSGPITAIWIDRKHKSFWGAASHYGEDYGIAW
ncbi:MAG: gamma-glutamyltransferase [Gemmatimonadetes bacterium]|nr:gamma-glutamyltransferase [Gemmatimonadota bacterium]